MSDIKFLDGTLEMDYTRSPGKTIGKFLSNLRDNEEILGIRCSKTSKVYAPPQTYAPESKTKMQNFVKLSSEGELGYFTIIHKQMPFTDWQPPFAYVAVKLDGSDTFIWHRMKETKGLKTGMKLKPKFKEQDKREGSILDIDYFESV